MRSHAPDTPFCPCCDGFGLIDVPQRPGRLKKCPECDTPPAPFPSLAELVGAPEEGEAEYWADAEKRRLEAERAEDAAVAAHGLAAPPDCACPWCTTQPKETPRA